MIEITFKNYRCFGDALHTFRIGDGVTAFLGPNNAGKSSILRLLRDLRPLFSSYAKIPALEGLCQGTKKHGELLTRIDDEGFWRALCDKNTRDFEVRVACLDAAGDGPEFSLTCRRGRDREAVVAAHMRRGDRREHIEVPENQATGDQSWKPAVESLRAVLKDLVATVFVGPFRNALNLAGHGTQHFDIIVGQQLVGRWRSLKNGESPDDARVARRLERRIAALLGFKSLEIGTAADLSTFHLVIDDHRYELGDMGSGTAHVMTVLLNLALAKPAYVLIDEPESGLHPRLQARFLEALDDTAGRGVLMATHHVGLARSAGRRVYTIRVAEDGSRAICPFDGTPSLAAFMGEMNFSAYRDLGYDGLLLVEGPMDLPVVRHFLRLLGKDHLVMLQPVRGDEGIAPHTERELQEVKRICPRVYAMIDSEKSREGEPLDRKRQGFVEACKASDIKCHVLARRSIENYFPETAVKSVLGSDAQALGLYETPKEAGWDSLSWSKRKHNWRIADAMTLDDLRNDMGEFLKSV